MEAHLGLPILYIRACVRACFARACVRDSKYKAWREARRTRYYKFVRPLLIVAIVAPGFNVSRFPRALRSGQLNARRVRPWRGFPRARRGAVPARLRLRKNA